MKKKGVKKQEENKRGRSGGETEKAERQRQEETQHKGETHAAPEATQHKALQNEAMHGQWSVSVCWPTSTRPREGDAL